MTHRDPAAVDALYATGHWLHQQGRIGHATDCFRALLLVAPTDERGWVGLGVCHEEAGQPELALEIYAMGSAAANQPARPLYAYGRLLAAGGRTDEARDALERAAAATNDDELHALIESARARLS